MTDTYEKLSQKKVLMYGHGETPEKLAIKLEKKNLRRRKRMLMKQELVKIELEETV